MAIVAPDTPGLDLGQSQIQPADTFSRPIGVDPALSENAARARQNGDILANAFTELGHSIRTTGNQVVGSYQNIMDERDREADKFYERNKGYIHQKLEEEIKDRVPEAAANDPNLVDLSVSGKAHAYSYLGQTTADNWTIGKFENFYRQPGALWNNKEDVDKFAESVIQEAWRTVRTGDPSYASGYMEQVHKSVEQFRTSAMNGRVNWIKDQQMSALAYETPTGPVGSGHDPKVHPPFLGLPSDYGSKGYRQPSYDAASTIAKFEGFIDSPRWDVNHYRVGYGSDTITTADNKVIEVKPGMRVTEEDARRDLQRRVGEFQQGIQRSIGSDAWGKLSEGARTALTSVAYNYGSIAKLKGLVEAAKAGDTKQMAQIIASQDVNKSRRLKEAAMIMGGGSGYRDPEGKPTDSPTTVSPVSGNPYYNPPAKHPYETVADIHDNNGPEAGAKAQANITALQGKGIALPTKTDLFITDIVGVDVAAKIINASGNAKLSDFVDMSKMKAHPELAQFNSVARFRAWASEKAGQPIHPITAAQNEIRDLDEYWRRTGNLVPAMRRDAIAKRLAETASTTGDKTVLDRMPPEWMNNETIDLFTKARKAADDTAWANHVRARQLQNDAREEKTRSSSLEILDKASKGEKINPFDYKDDTEAYKFAVQVSTQPRVDAATSVSNAQKLSNKIEQAEMSGVWSKLNPEWTSPPSDTKVVEYIMNNSKDMNPDTVAVLMTNVGKIRQVAQSVNRDEFTAAKSRLTESARYFSQSPALQTANRIISWNGQPITSLASSVQKSFETDVITMLKERAADHELTPRDYREVADAVEEKSNKYLNDQYNLIMKTLSAGPTAPTSSASPTDKPLPNGRFEMINGVKKWVDTPLPDGGD